ncbi:hypothetical protein [uncultured Draconibacterium sp.]|uniref:BACON domain-containing protein n=1 Tax=uncultured Draconibacterium sp. TaxID=1573823 RepID=UPI003260A04E
MKKNTGFYKSCLAIVWLLAINVLVACNFNFPEENQEQVFTTDVQNHFDTGTTSGVIQFNLSGSDNGKFRVVVYPQWLGIKTFEGNLSNGNCTIPFDFKNVNDFMVDGRAEGYLFVKLGDAGVFRITVSYGKTTAEQPPVEGQEPMYCSTAEIDFGTEDNRSFSIANYGSVDKYWYIENIPEWLELSPASGTLYGGETKDIYCTVNRGEMTPGDYSQIINIESNNPQLSHGVRINMTVAASGDPVNSKSLTWFDGELKDAYYHKTTDVLYLLTRSPNKLLVKTTGSTEFNAYDLERVPYCIDVSEDGKMLVIGYNQAYVDVWNAETLQREKLIETDCVPYDVALGENGWCYLAPDEDQHVHLYSLNLETGVTFRSTSSVALYEKSVLRKIPGKPLIYITRPQLSPTGLLIANIEKGAANDTIPSWHESIGKDFWFTPDLNALIGANKVVFRTPDYTTQSVHGQELSRLGTIEIPRNSIQSLDYNQKLETYFVVGSDYWWAPDAAETIYQVDAVSYSAVKSFKVSTYPGYLNNQNNPDMDVHFVFTNLSGTELYALKNVDRTLEMNKWALEIFSLPLE